MMIALIVNIMIASSQTRSVTMELNEYQKLASRTIAKNMNEQDMEMHALHGMVGEVGELHSIYQKIYQGHMADHTHQKKELGDLLWFIAEYCTAHEWKMSELIRERKSKRIISKLLSYVAKYSTSKGWTLDDVASTNIDKLKARYPMGFSPDNSLHRKEGDI